MPLSSQSWPHWWLAVWLLLGSLVGRVAASPSLVLSEPPGWNGWVVGAKVKAGFRKAGVAAGAGSEVAVNDTKSLPVVAYGHTPGEVLTMPTATAVVVPGSGAAKDKAQGAVEFRYRVGSAAMADTFEFSLPSTTSAVAAKVDFGSGLESADAFVECELTINGYGPLAGASLRLPDMPALTHGATSTEEMLVLLDGPVVGYMLPGHPGYAFPITLGGAEHFQYKLTYSIVTAYGQDPVVRYDFSGSAEALAAAPVPMPTASESSVRAEMPQVKLNRLIYEHGMGVSATVCFREVNDVQSHATVVLVSPKNEDIEVLTLLPTGDPKVFTTAPIPFHTSGADTKYDGALTVPPGEKFTALYSYHFSNRIQPDPTHGLKPGDPFVSSDYGLAFDPNYSGAAVTITPTLAFGMNEEAPPNGLRRLGTLALEGVPGVVQMASEDLIVAPASPAQETEFAIRAKASFVSDDAAWKGPNGQAVWKRYHLTDSPANQSEREERIKYLPQMLGLVGTVGKLHGSNARVLGLFATGLELWLDGFNCAVNPRMIPNGDFSTPESSHFVGFGGGAALLPDNFDSMRTPYNHFNDPLQNLRDLWAESAMQDHDAETINVAFIDSAFAPNPDFRGYPDGIPQFNMQTGARGPHVAEFPETAAAGSRNHVWHGNGTVAVAGGVMGNRYGLAGVAGQVMQPMLYYMGTAEFVFESGQAMELAVADGADVINMSAGYPCRILTVLGPIRLCSVEDRAALTSTVAGLVAGSLAVVCASTAGLDIFFPGLGTSLCATATVAATTAIGTLFASLFVNAAIGDPRHAMETGVAVAKAAGVPVVVSAGNQHQFDWSQLGELQHLFQTDNARTDEWEIIPAVIPAVICVGSTTPEAPYPNVQFFGPAVDLWAPEGQLVLLPFDGADPSPANVAPSAQQMRDFTGSSAAAPFVTGVIAHMMSVNPSMDRHRAAAPERATAVDRISTMLRNTATVPGSRPEVPVSDPLGVNFEIARRGRIVNAHAAREAALVAAGGTPLADTGFNASFARFDNEGAVTTDRDLIETLHPTPISTEVRFGGLPAGDVDVWAIDPPSHSSISEIRVQIAVPLASGTPPPFLLNGFTAIPRISLVSDLAVYEIIFTGCSEQRLTLSCLGALPGGASPMRRVDVLYLLSVQFLRTVPESEPDRFEPNNAGITSFVAAPWLPHPGPATLACTAASQQMVVTDTTLSGCEDTDFYRIPAWEGYDPSIDATGTVRVELDPPIPTATLQFLELFTRSGGSTTLEVASPVVGGATVLEINADVHPFPLAIKIRGATPTHFNVKISHCIPDPGAITSEADAARARLGPRGMREFWENMRELRLVTLTGPMLFDPHFTCEMVKFPYPKDPHSRSQQGQVFRIINRTTGPLRVLGLPDGDNPSLRFDYYDLAGNNLGTAATVDLLGDPGLGIKDTAPLGKPLSLQTASQPPGEYLLAVSGFHFLDIWTLLLGENQSAPGQFNAEGLGKPDPAAMLNLGETPQAHSAAFELMGTDFRSHLLPGLATVFIPPFGGWRPEYSLDGETWNEAGPASNVPMFPTFSALPLPSLDGKFGFLRYRNLLESRAIEPYTFSPPRAINYLAVPTTPSGSYILEESTDLLIWTQGTPMIGDGSVFVWEMPMWQERDFFRVRQED